MSEVMSASASQSEILPTEYEPGVCNIGPAEMEGRRRSAISGTIVALVAYAALVVAQAPGVLRGGITGLLAAGAIVGWLQVRLRFCVAFGSRGVTNFGPLGAVTAIGDPALRAADRRKAAWMIAAGLAGGALLGILAAFWP